MDLVLNEEIYQGDKCSKEARCQDFSVLNSSRVLRAEGQTTQSPWKGSYEIRDHENVVPVVVVGRSDIRPTATGDGSEKSSSSYYLRQH